MVKFRYQAQRDGAVERGIVEAESKREATEQLRAQGLKSVRVRRSPGETAKLFRRFLGGD